MAITTHQDGDRLIETKARFIANMESLIAAKTLLDAADYDLNVGKHTLIPFRRAAEVLLAQAATDLSVTTLTALVEGDRIYTIREKLNDNFTILNAVANP